MINILEILDSERARINFIKGLIYLSKATEKKEGLGGIDESELVFLRNSMRALCLEQEIQNKLEEFIMLKEIRIDLSFDSKKQTLFFFREAIQLCYIDGMYQQAEKDMVLEMAKMLGVELNIIDKIEKWVLEGIEWLQRGDKLLELEG
ncbi:MAG: hypothetical protein A4E55_02397 [Pelotomaculum sp. PtaU1.Bin035]|nr:MAG: hypothetical protein A4E55_02397 [Pelotomaculum sp. PtaU1.Bin035]